MSAKKIYLLFSLAFVFYLIGHILWSISLIYNQTFFFDESTQIWIINIPFGLFALLGLIGSIKLYQNS
ncbi:MAG: hypothetical protein ACJZ0Y_06515 [Cytophagales bacterium]|jgi:hypothetical protein|nr:hypothetical protein [Cytophagales bacterium]PDH41843.1 MAG: hypothetical protein CND83_02980 [Rhodothermaeota bacterium MED-G19]